MIKKLFLFIKSNKKTANTMLLGSLIICAVCWLFVKEQDWEIIIIGALFFCLAFAITIIGSQD